MFYLIYYLVLLYSYIIIMQNNTLFNSVIKINCDDNPRMTTVFADGFNKEKILLAFQAETGVKAVPNETLIILDEIQEIPNALKALKYTWR